MIYYPLSVLMLADIRDILIISTSTDLESFRRLLGDGSALGLRLTYAAQEEPKGIAEAFLIGADHVGSDSVALVLGDNIFHGPKLSGLLTASGDQLDGCVLFGYPVRDPQRYGVAQCDQHGRLVSIQEKPARPRSNLAVTGLYLYDNDVLEISRSITPSARGELEITDVNQTYLRRGKASLVNLGRGFTWLDAGTHDSLTEAGQYVQIMEHRQGVRIGCIEEIALRMGFIDNEQCYALGEILSKSPYGQYIMEISTAAPLLSVAN
jgi:glucose-1-phosphate thymidylyltransferase